MANTIITKNSSTASAVPTSGDLVQGELAVNVTDKRLFTEDSGGTVVELGVNPTSVTTGNLTATGTVSIPDNAISGDKVEGGTIASITLTSADINGGTIDNTAIGGATPAAGAFTTLAASGIAKLTGGASSRLEFDVGGSEYARILLNGSNTLDFAAGSTTPTMNIANGAVAVTGTLSASGAVTLSGGTANGVAYLNGSKAITTGSALTFDGSKLGIGTSSPQAYLQVGSGAITPAVTTGATIQHPYTPVLSLLAPSATAATARVTFGTELSTQAASIIYTNSTGILQITSTGGSTSGDITFFSAGSEQMRLTSTGLGIGTSSPSSKLHVAATNAIITATGTTGWSGLTVSKTNGALIVGLDDGATFGQADGSAIIRNASGKGLYYYNSTTLRLALDPSGNLGLGTTTLNTGSYGKALTVAAIASAYGGVEVSGTTGGALEFQTSQSTRQVQLLGNSDGFIINVNDGSSLTQRLRITASGNVGIGTSSPSASAILDAQSTTKGVRMPNMTTTQKNAIASPAAGLMVFDTTLAKLCVYSGAAWQTITSI